MGGEESEIESFLIPNAEPIPLLPPWDPVECPDVAAPPPRRGFAILEPGKGESEVERPRGEFNRAASRRSLTAASCVSKLNGKRGGE